MLWKGKEEDGDAKKALVALVHDKHDKIETKIGPDQIDTKSGRTRPPCPPTGPYSDIMEPWLTGTC